MSPLVIERSGFVGPASVILGVEVKGKEDEEHGDGEHDPGNEKFKIEFLKNKTKLQFILFHPGVNPIK